MKRPIVAWVVCIVVGGCAGTPRNVPSSFNPARDTVLVALRDSTNTCGTPVYPDGLRVTGVEGRVLISVFVDTTGRALRDSVRVLETTDPGFVAPAVEFTVACRYTVPRLKGQATATRLTVPVEFRLQGAGRVTVPGRTLRPN